MPRYFCSYYYAHLGRFLLNTDYALLPFAELPRCKDQFFDTFARDGLLFIRPNSPLKFFSGLTVSRNTFERDYEFMGFYDFPTESLIVVSSPKQVVAEWRFVIAGDTIVAGSQYSEQGKPAVQPTVDPKAREFAQTVLNKDYRPDPIWILDIGKTQTGDYGVVEAGGFSFSNLYACDLDAVVQAVSSAAIEMHRKNEQLWSC